MSTASILLVDDHEVVRQGLSLLIEREPDLRVTGIAADAAQAYEQLRTQRFDLALVDVSLAGVSGLEVVRRIAEQHPSTRILVLTMHEEALYWERTMAAGAHGFVMKRDGAARLIEGLRAVHGGSMFYGEQVQARLAEMARHLRREQPQSPVDALSDKELDVLRLIGRGLGTSDIAARLVRSVKTVETHKANLKVKLGLASSHELTRWAMRWVVDGGDTSFGRIDSTR